MKLSAAVYEEAAPFEQLENYYFECGDVAYSAYKRYVDSRNLVSGIKLPEFSQLHPRDIVAWAFSAIAMERVFNPRGKL